MSKDTLKVSPIPDHPMWYYVESQTYPEPNQVHLDTYNGNGSCNCDDMSFTCITNIKKFPGKFIDYGTKKDKNPDRTRCKHIKVAIKYWGDSVLRSVAQDLQKGKR